jgi:molybdopterin adenylyltransferase
MPPVQLYSKPRFLRLQHDERRGQIGGLRAVWLVTACATPAPKWRSRRPQPVYNTLSSEREEQQVSAEQHRAYAADQVSAVPCGVLTLSDTRTEATDTGGARVKQGLTDAGHQVVRYAVAKDERAQIIALVEEYIDAGCKVIITSGGTGIARRDSTFEAIDGLLEKRLPGFGEIFRMLSFQEIGPAAMLSRATAGVYRGALIFCLPGSPAAVRLAMERLIEPELNHLVWETIR